jgi:hypothetical protein
VAQRENFARAAACDDHLDTAAHANRETEFPALDRIFRYAISSILCVALMLRSGELIAQDVKTAAPCGCPRDIWLIDTRCLSDCECDIGKARFLRLNEKCQWVTESKESFLSTLDPAKPVNFWLPGYRTNERFTVEHGWALYRKLEQQAKCRGLECAPIRFVMWSWPSEKSTLGQVRDARQKAERADREGLWAAMLIAKMPSEAKVNLIGYSLGARIATATAHYLAGGYCGSCPFGAAPDSPRLSGALVASAVDSTWLNQCQPHSMAVQRFERLLLINNCSDFALKFFRVLDRSSRPEALGAVGLLLPDAGDASHVEQWEVSSLVGRIHDWLRYIGTPEIMSAIARYAFYLD